MQDYAVIKIDHRQYVVEAGKEYVVDKFPANVGEKIALDVLASATKGELTVGRPLVKNVKAQVEIISQEQGEKVQTKIFKAKSRYRRTRGTRKQVTKFKVVSIK